MGSSFIEFRGKGFWSRDAFIEEFLNELATAALANKPEGWLRGAAAHWHLQASGMFSGWVHSCFDELLTDDARRATAEALVSSLTRRIDLPEHVAATASLVLRLLRGELSTDASSPLDYMVTSVGTTAFEKRQEDPRFQPPDPEHGGSWRLIGSDIWRDGGSYSATLEYAGRTYSLWLQVLPWDQPDLLRYGALYVSAGADATLMEHAVAPADELAWSNVLGQAVESASQTDRARELLEILRARHVSAG